MTLLPRPDRHQATGRRLKTTLRLLQGRRRVTDHPAMTLHLLLDRPRATRVSLVRTLLRLRALRPLIALKTI
jgi:hypothetical protein